MTIILDNYAIPEKGRIEVSLSFEIEVTAEEARRKVNRWLHEHVSMLISAEEPPSLRVGKQIAWRVPAHIGFPGVGRAGFVGMVDVDAEIGELINASERKAEIERRAEAIASQLPPRQPRSSLPPEFIPQHIPVASKLILPVDEEAELTA